MKNKKINIALILCLCLLFLMFYYAKVYPKKMTLTVGFFSGSNWDAPDNESVKILDYAIKKFEEEHKGVKVRYISGIQKKDYSEWISGLFLAGKEPDVFLLTAEDFNLLASKNALLNLDGLIQNDTGFAQEDYYEGPLSFGKYNQIQYALPYECMPTLMAVNQTLLKKNKIEIPDSDWDWADFHTICRRLTKDIDADGEIDQFGVYNYTWQDAAYSNGAYLFNDDGTENYVDSNQVVNAVNFVYAIYALNGGYEVTLKDFELGKTAFYPMSFSTYKTYKTYPWCLKKYTDFEWDCITMPAGPSGDNISEFNALLMGISKRTKEKHLAWEFLKTMTYDEEIQKKIFQYSEGISPLIHITGSKEILNIVNQNNSMVGISVPLLDQVMNKTVASSRFNKYEEAIFILNEGVENAMESEKNIRSALISLKRRINNFLKNG